MLARKFTAPGRRRDTASHQAALDARYLDLNVIRAECFNTEFSDSTKNRFLQSMTEGGLDIVGQWPLLDSPAEAVSEPPMHG